mgnify:CR=1 FL=1
MWQEFANAPVFLHQVQLLHFNFDAVIEIVVVYLTQNADFLLRIHILAASNVLVDFDFDATSVVLKPKFFRIDGVSAV